MISATIFYSLIKIILALVKKLLKVMKVPQVFDAELEREAKMQAYLKSRNKNLKQDKTGNLYIINKDTPLICAHMDTVWSQQAQTLIKNIRIVKPWEFTGRFNNDKKPILNTFPSKIIIGQDNIWADDKCGVTLAMELYEKYWDKISILFTVGEETGWEWIDKFNKKLLAKCTYAIIPDRMNWTDFIWDKNDYCSTEFGDKVLQHIGQFGYTNARWVRSDCDEISEHINCFNISVWYYQQHTSNEYVNIDEFENTYNTLCYLIENFNERLEKPTKYKRGWGYDEIYSVDKWYYPAKYNTNYVSPAEIEWDILYVYETIKLYSSTGKEILLTPDDYYMSSELVWYNPISKQPIDTNELVDYDDDFGI